MCTFGSRREREKKARNFGPPTLRAPQPFRPSTFSGFGPPPLRSPPLRAPTPSGPHPFGPSSPPLNEHPTTPQKKNGQICGLAKFGQKKIGQFGQIRLAKCGQIRLAKCGQLSLAKCGPGQMRFGQMRRNKDGQIRFGQMRSPPSRPGCWKVSSCSRMLTTCTSFVNPTSVQRCMPS